MHIEVKANYEEHSKKKVKGASGVVATVASVFNPTAAGVEVVGVSEGLNEALAGTTLLDRDKTGVPKAYLNYVVMNEERQVIDRGFVPVSEAARIKTGKRKKGKGRRKAETDSVAHETLAVDLDIEEEGYLYTYVSNESNWDVDVHFDQMAVAASSSAPSIVQSNDYYAFGMTHQQPLSDPINDFLYNGKEITTDFELNWYDYGFRWYDPAIGRFTGGDPIADEFPHVTVYNYAENEPIANIDLWGLQKFNVISRAFIPQQSLPNPRTGLPFVCRGGSYHCCRFYAIFLSFF